MSVQPEMMETDEVIQELQVNEEEEDIVEEEEEEEKEEEEGEEEEEEKEEAENGPGDDQQQELGPAKKKRERKEPAALKREPGKSLLPFSRVQKVIKADKDIPIIAKDAVFLVSLATEAFIAELAQAAQKVAEKERRTTVQHKDIATVVRKADEFMFLEDIIQWTGPDPEKKRGKPRIGPKAGVSTLLDGFVVSKESGLGVGRNVNEVVMNEDGTMYAVDE